ncbi:unnamed protein product [Adineta ricciae]|uniref:Uncharacterized protein n=1 Tax=Adineta ricciae TaxID=249248 RepID=A0A816ARY2_ADIRI|nr:unnamed protein product [Adineta ricciae]
MRFLIFICFIASVSSSVDRFLIHSIDDCWAIETNNTITDAHSALISFSPILAEKIDPCSVHITNPWISEIQNGFGVYLPHGMDCSSIITIECLPGSALFQHTMPSSVQYTCRTNASGIVMPCNSISLTSKRNVSYQGSRRVVDVQLVALAKEPCMNKDLFFQCPKDYPRSCIARKLRCNGRTECFSGDDEYHCEHSYGEGYLPLGLIILLIIGFLFVVCIVSTIFACCFCRAACHAIIRRFHPSKKQKLFQKNDTTMVTGEDAGLMRGLTTSHVVEALPQQHAEPAPLIIDSTKPVYPHLS